MFHRRHHRRRSIRASWLRLAAALAVMLLAVLPHATLAASAGHAMPVADASQHGGSHGAEMAMVGEPCHQSGKPAPASHGAAPSCCVLGCGLIACAPALAGHVVITRWESIAPGRERPGNGLPPEPAERPPRPHSSLA